LIIKTAALVAIFSIFGIRLSAKNLTFHTLIGAFCRKAAYTKLSALGDTFDQTEYQINDPISFMRFWELGIGERVPDAKTIWVYEDKVET